MRSTLTLLVLVLAGCAEPPAETQREPDIFGLVIDGDGTLLVGATIALVEINATAVTDAQGEYAFFDVPYGEPLTLVASFEGHHDQAARVQVGEFLSAQVVFTLVDLDDFPLQYVSTFEGFFGCRTPPVPCPLATDRPADRFQIDVPHSDILLVDALLEVEGNSSPLDTEFRVTATHAGGQIEAEGPTPLQITVPPDVSLEVFVEPAGATGAAIAQRFTVHVTHSTVVLPPGYSAAS